MELKISSEPRLNLEMETNQHYREMAESYKSSEAYSKMIGLYQILEDSIKDCEDEKLIN